MTYSPADARPREISAPFHGAGRSIWISWIREENPFALFGGHCPMSKMSIVAKILVDLVPQVRVHICMPTLDPGPIGE